MPGGSKLHERLERCEAMLQRMDEQLSMAPRDGRYRKLLLETAAVLEKTRHSFKSRQLKCLREKILETLENEHESSSH